MSEWFLAVGELLESAFKTPELHVVLSRSNGLEHAHGCQSVFELLVHVLGDVHCCRNEATRMLQILNQGLKITEELLKEFLRDFACHEPLSFSYEVVHATTGEIDIGNTDDGTHTHLQIVDGHTFGGIRRLLRHSPIELVQEMVVAELLRNGLPVDVNGSVANPFVAVPHEDMDVIPILLHLLEEEDEIDHVLIVTDAVVREIARVVIRADERDQFMEKALVVIGEPSLLLREFREGVADVDVRSIDAEDTSPFWLQVAGNPCTVPHASGHGVHISNRCGFRWATAPLDRAVATVIFEMSSHDLPLVPIFPERECLPAIEAVDELDDLAFVPPLPSALRRKIAAVRTAYFLAWRKVGKR